MTICIMKSDVEAEENTRANMRGVSRKNGLERRDSLVGSIVHLITQKLREEIRRTIPENVVFEEGSTKSYRIRIKLDDGWPEGIINSVKSQLREQGRDLMPNFSVSDEDGFIVLRWRQTVC